MLMLTNVEKTFNKGTVNEKKALCGLNLTLKDGDFVTVIGGNGAGKSTMLNMICGVYPIDKGKIPGPCVSGSHDGNSSRHGDRRKSGPGIPQGLEARDEMGDHEG